MRPTSSKLIAVSGFLPRLAIIAISTKDRESVLCTFTYKKEDEEKKTWDPRITQASLWKINPHSD